MLANYLVAFSSILFRSSISPTIFPLLKMHILLESLINSGISEEIRMIDFFSTFARFQIN